MKKLILGVFLAVCWCIGTANAQDIAAKTNLLYWSSTTPNLSLEFGLGKRTTLNLTGAYYNISGVRVLFQDKSTKDHRYQGWVTGVGLSYGYSWILGKRWNLEATVGLGYVYTDYDKYECATCGEFKESGSKHYFGPTKASISLIYMIK